MKYNDYIMLPMKGNKRTKQAELKVRVSPSIIRSLKTCFPERIFKSFDNDIDTVVIKLLSGTKHHPADLTRLNVLIVGILFTLPPYNEQPEKKAEVRKELEKHTEARRKFFETYISDFINDEVKRLSKRESFAGWATKMLVDIVAPVCYALFDETTVFTPEEFQKDLKKRVEKRADNI